MERAKKMALISLENLERMQRQLQQQQQPSAIEEPKENTRNSENSEIANNSVRTPGTPLSRLDAEMSRILNSPSPHNEDERWKMYKEVLWRYLHFVRAARNHEDTRNAGEEDENVADTREGESLDPSSSQLERSLTIKRNLTMLESISKIAESVPKTYRADARLLTRYLLDKAVPNRINWNERGVVTIDGNVVKDSNIADLINDAMRERKTVKAVGRVQFAQLLRDLNTPSILVKNSKLLAAGTSNIEKLDDPTASSTPKRTLDSSPTRKRRLLDWDKLK